MDELLKELQALIDKYAEGTPEGVTEEEAKQDEERMAELTAEIERKTTEQAEQRKTRAAAVAAARSAIESGAAPKVSCRWHAARAPPVPSCATLPTTKPQRSAVGSKTLRPARAFSLAAATR